MIIGSVSRIARFPFKSMSAESVEEASLTYSGLQGDRTFALVNAASRKTFPWLSIRECPELVLFRPKYRNIPTPSNPYPQACEYELELQLPDGRSLSTADPGFESTLIKALGRDCHVRFSERSMVDARPLSILSEQTIRTAETEMGRKLDWRRFRANIYIDWIDLDGFGEGSFVGKTLAIGEKAEVLISKKDPRCAIITVDPDTGERDARILKHVVSHHENCMGVYGVTVREGSIRVGDSVTLRPPSIGHRSYKT